MDLQTFLKAVVPVGRVIVARKVDRTDEHGKAFATFSHTVCKTHEEAANTALAQAAGGQDVYFALASYKQGFHEVTKNGKTKKVVRVRDNVDALQALWFDIDFKGGYADPHAVLIALRAFCQQVQMPLPAILVGSGNGVHAYWPFATSVSPDRWQRLADALKEAAKAVGLTADLVCTADACRVLRPPGTWNFKDPANPKSVKILYSSAKTFAIDDLEGPLTPYFKAARLAVTGVNSDLTGGLTSTPAKPSSFAEIQKHCGVARWLVETHGETCSEPEWVATLQLLKHCEDGEIWVHPVSDGHPEYDPAAVDRKWDQRKANTAGPTLCGTFETYRPDICGKCPHNGFIKTPLAVGHEGTESIEGLPPTWRVAADRSGIERLHVVDDAGTKEWIRVMQYIPSNLRVSKSVNDGTHDFVIDFELRSSGHWTVALPASHLGNRRKLEETLSSFGVLMHGKELNAFGDLMSSWIKTLQNSKRVSEVTEQLGWIYVGEQIGGFACSPTVYYADGRTRNDVRPSREFTTLAKLYEPKGSLDEWKKVANFLANQNSPALTAVLAAAFAAPLLRFVGLHGGIMSLVSSASGVGKSSALKCSQAVWGNPSRAVNSVDDTPKSVAKKLGFLNNLPAYWDELRGKRTVEDFTQLAFQVTQGKERSRLDSSANLREIQTWETLLVVASNESIFEAMAAKTTGSDAGMVRTFEMLMEHPPATEKSPADLTILFEGVSDNYGHAGRVYAHHLAQHHAEIRQRVQTTFAAISKTMGPQERFWYGIAAVLLVGASEAARCNLVQINTKTLAAFLLRNIDRLRGRTVETGDIYSSNDEVLAAFMRERGDSLLIVDKFPSRTTTANHYLPEIVAPPRQNKVSIWVSRDEKKMRFSVADFYGFCNDKGIPSYGAVARIRKIAGSKDVRCQLAIGTRYEQPRTRCIEIPIADSLASPEESSDSQT